MDRTVPGRCRANGADDDVTEEHAAITDSFLDEGAVEATASSSLSSPSAPAAVSSIFNGSDDDGNHNLKMKESLRDEGLIEGPRESKQEPLLKSKEKRASAPSTTATSSITAADQPVSDASSLSNTNQLSPQQQQDATSSAQSCPSPVALRTTSSRSQRQESPQPPNDPLLLPHHPHDHSMPDAPLPYPSTKKRTKKEQSILDTTQLVLRHLQDDSAFFAQASQLEERRPSPTTTRNIPVFDTNGMSVPDKERLSYIVCVVIGRPKLTMAGYYLPFNQWVLTVLSVSHHI